MKIFKQRNCYFVDIRKKAFKGYTEIHIRRAAEEFILSFISNSIEIETAIIVGQKYHLTPKFSKKGKFCEKWNLSDGFEISIPQSFKNTNFILRLCFSPSISNLTFYRPVSNEDTHRELLVMDPSSACPYISSVTDLELIYILPNGRDIELISSGTFVSFKEKSKSLIYVYESKNTNPENIGFSMGTYNKQSIEDDCNSFFPSFLETDTSEYQFDLQNIIKFIRNSAEIGPTSILFTLACVDIQTKKDFLVLRYDFLGRPRYIELNIQLKEILCEKLSELVFMYLNFKKIDSWIFRGLSGYLSDMALRYLLGNNEYLYRYYRDKEYLLENDILEPPLFYQERTNLEYQSKFFKIKSKMVFHCMNAQLSAAFLKKIITAVIKLKFGERNKLIDKKFVEEKCDIPKKIKISLFKNEDTTLKPINNNSTPKVIIKKTIIDNILSNQNFIQNDSEKSFTPFFINIVKDSSGKELKQFFDFYIFNPGLVRIEIFVQINSKKNSVQINSKEIPTTLLKTSNTHFPESLKIKSYENDGTFIHKIPTDKPSTYYYHKKTDSGGVLFIRADPRREHLIGVKIYQPDFMFIEQLSDRNVIGQIEALESFRNNVSEKVIETMERILGDPHTFIRIKEMICSIMRDVRLLVDDKINSVPENRFNGVMRLIQTFIKLRCAPLSTVLKNSDSGIINFLLQKSIVKNISNNSIEDTNIIKVIIAFLHNIINYNDNTKDQFDDSFYIFNIINQLSKYTILICEGEKFTDKLNFSEDKLSRSIDKFNTYSIDKLKSYIQLIERFRILDMVFPSVNNLITKACVMSLIRLSYHQKLSIKKSYLLDLAKYPNFCKLRILAFEGLLILYSDKLDIREFISVDETAFIIRNLLFIILKMIFLNFEKILLFSKFNLDFINEFENIYSKDLEIKSYIKIIRESIISNNCDIHSVINDSGLFNFFFHNFELKSIDKKFLQNFIDQINSNLANEIKLTYERPNESKKIIISDYNQLRFEVFQSTFKFRLQIPKIKQLKSTFRLKCSKIRPKNVYGGYLLRIKEQKTVKYRNCDVPQLILKKLGENKSFVLIEKFLNTQSIQECYEFPPVTFEKLSNEFFKEDYISEEKMKNDKNFENQYFRHVGRKCLCNFVDTVFNTLRYVMAYSTANSKLCLGAKTLFNAVEKVVFQYNLIPPTICKMDSEKLKSCVKFFMKIYENPKYDVFKEPVSLEEFKTYLDFVRIPVCLNSVKEKLFTENIKSESEPEFKNGDESNIKPQFNQLINTDLNIKPENSFYKSFDAFFYDMERIALNCKNFNSKNSDIFNISCMFQEELYFFRNSISIVPYDSKKVIEEIFLSLKSSDFDVSPDEVRTWNDLEEILQRIKKKYSRYSVNGKALSLKVCEARRLIAGYFLYENGKVFKIID